MPRLNEPSPLHSIVDKEREEESTSMQLQKVCTRGNIESMGRNHILMVT